MHRCIAHHFNGKRWIAMLQVFKFQDLQILASPSLHWTCVHRLHGWITFSHFKITLNYEVALCWRATLLTRMCEELPQGLEPGTHSFYEPSCELQRCWLDTISWQITAAMHVIIRLQAWSGEFVWIQQLDTEYVYFSSNSQVVLIVTPYNTTCTNRHLEHAPISVFIATRACRII